MQDIKTGDVGLVRRHVTLNPLTWISAVVRFLTGSRWNHALAFIKFQDVLYVIESVESGTRMYSYYSWKQKYKCDIRIIRYSNLDKKNIAGKLMKHVGKPYDYAALIKHQVIFQLARWFGVDKWIGRTDKTGADNKIYCSELIAIAYGFDRWWTYTAADLLNHKHEIIYNSITALK